MTSEIIAMLNALSTVTEYISLKENHTLHLLLLA